MYNASVDLTLYLLCPTCLIFQKRQIIKQYTHKSKAHVDLAVYDSKREPSTVQVSDENECVISWIKRSSRFCHPIRIRQLSKILD